MKFLQIVTILITMFLISSCHSFNQQYGHIIGIKFCKPGLFEIHSEVRQWTMLKKKMWKAELAQLKIITTTKNIPATVSGFYNEKHDGMNSFQAEICEKKRFPSEKLILYIVSDVKPGILSFYMKKNITQNDCFVEFEASHFQCANIHPKKISVGRKNHRTFLYLLFESLPQPVFPQKKVVSTQVNKRSVNEKIYSGLYFDDEGEFDISGTIPMHEWEEYQPGQWLAKLQRLEVRVQNVNCFFSGFHFYQKDNVIDKHRYQMEIGASKSGLTQGKPLNIIIKSSQCPDKLTFFAKQKMNSPQSLFVPFSKEHFKINNINASFLIHDFLNDQEPSICLTFLNMNPTVQSKPLNTGNLFQKNSHGIFTPFSKLLSPALSMRISDIFLKSLENKLIYYINNNNFNIRKLNYPNNYDPFTSQLLNSPMITIGNQFQDRIVSVIQENLKYNQKIAFACLEEDLLLETLTFKLHVYSSPTQPATVLAVPIDLSTNVQQNIVTAMAHSVKQFVASSPPSAKSATSNNQLKNVTYNTYEEIYDNIFTHNLYCTPDVTNIEKLNAIQSIAGKKQLSEQVLLQEMSTYSWTSGYTVQTNTALDDFMQVVHIVKTRNIHGASTMPHSLYMNCLLNTKVATNSDLHTITQNIKTYAGIDHWRIPSILELLRIFQQVNINHYKKLLKLNEHYQFWSCTQASNNTFWLISVRWNDQQPLMLDVNMASTSNYARMLIVSDNPN